MSAPTPTILVVHHSADLDGICSREVARRALSGAADYLGWDYGQSIPDLSPYSTVYLIDISFPRPVMEKHAGKLIWIDHHKSAISDMEGLDIPGYRIDGVAACRLAYQWFLYEWRQSLGMIWMLPDKRSYVDGAVEEPYAVKLLGEYDIWDKRDPNTDPFQLGMLGQKTPNWPLLLRLQTEAGPGEEHIQPHYLEEIITAGRAIQAFTEVTNAQISVERGFDVTWEGLNFRALNTARCNSMTFAAALRPEHDACLAYFWNGSKWKVSLYHAPGKEHHDLSLIAAKHGGGGHRGACGFSLDNIPSAWGGFRWKDSDFAGHPL